jgi:predicted lysophospholipase L1 biosynthesis ABC-type transport system permease subunit
MNILLQDLRYGFRMLLKQKGLTAVALLSLAAIGLFGVLAYMVSQRTHEIGISMALGASRAEVLKMIVRQGMVLALLGVVTVCTWAGSVPGAIATGWCVVKKYESTNHDQSTRSLPLPVLTRPKCNWQSAIGG